MAIIIFAKEFPLALVMYNATRAVTNIGTRLSRPGQILKGLRSDIVIAEDMSDGRGKSS